MLKVDIRALTYGNLQAGTTTVLRDIGFALHAGEFITLVGPSGVGKSTLLRAVLGLQAGFDGTIAKPRSLREAAVFQNPDLLPWMTVMKNLQLVQPPANGRDAIPALAETLGLTPHLAKLPGQLSLGQQRRAAIARALVVAPDLLVLDEPFVSLDEDTARRALDLLIRALDGRPTGCLMATHNLNEAVRLSDRILVLSAETHGIVGRLSLTVPRGQRDTVFCATQLAELRHLVSPTPL